MSKSGIEWTEYGWPVVTGCTKCSPGCQNCYAARLAATRLKHHPYYKGLARPVTATYPKWPGAGPEDVEEGVVTGYDWTGEVRLNREELDKPLHWRKPRVIFVAHTGDLFHESVPDEFIRQVYGIMAKAKQHTFIVLTKRPERMSDWVEGNPDYWRNGDGDPLRNVWLGVTVCNQEEADANIPVLLQMPAAKRFVSIEPCLGPVIPILKRGVCMCGHIQYTDNPVGKMFERAAVYCPKCGYAYDPYISSHIDWIIAGAESGKNSRPADYNWFKALKDHCVTQGVPFFFKQGPDDNGNWCKMPTLDGQKWSERP